MMKVTEDIIICQLDYLLFLKGTNFSLSSPFTLFSIPYLFLYSKFPSFPFLTFSSPFLSFLSFPFLTFSLPFPFLFIYFLTLLYLFLPFFSNFLLSSSTPLLLYISHSFYYFEGLRGTFFSTHRCRAHNKVNCLPRKVT